MRVQVPFNLEITEELYENFFNEVTSEYIIDRYDFDIENEADTEILLNIIKFIYHPIVERIEYHYLRQNHYIGNYETEKECTEFIENLISNFVHSKLNYFDYLFQSKKWLIDVSDVGERIVDNGTNSREIDETNTSYRVDEISPINASIDNINTPNTKVESNFTIDKNDTDTTNHTKTIYSLDRIKEFMDITLFSFYEKECNRFVDSLIDEYNIIW